MQKGWFKADIMIPMIKEYRINKMLSCLECIDNNMFDRDKQRECILNLYPGKNEKSVFRGMVISTLRHLDLIVGYSDMIGISANAKLMIKSKRNQELHDRVIRAVFVEIDLKTFKFLDLVKTKGRFVYSGDNRLREREGKWMTILTQLKIIENDSINNKILNKTLIDLDKKSKKDSFNKALFSGYEKLANTINMADIESLREKVALFFLSQNKILTEDQFDGLLKDIKPVTKDYIISFGSSIGTGKPFKYGNDYYGTISIKKLVE